MGKGRAVRAGQMDFRFGDFRRVGVLDRVWFKILDGVMDSHVQWIANTICPRSSDQFI